MLNPIPETGWKVIKESPLIWQLQKSIHRTKPQPWQTNINYTGSLDGSKTDPDTDLSNLNSYEVNNHLVSFSNQFTYTRKQPSIYRETDIQITANQRFDKIKQTKFVQLENAMAFPLSRVEERI